MKTMTSISFLKGRRSTINQRARRRFLAALLLAIGLLPMLHSGVLAQVSERIITYQAQILKAGTVVPDGLYHLTASLYKDAEGNAMLWRSTYVAEVRSGIANLNLGEVRNGSVPLPEEGLDGPLYLGISVGRSAAEVGEEMRPLTQLTSSLNALSVADNSITKDKLNTSYVEKIIINGDTIDGRGSALKIDAGPGITIARTGTNRYHIGSIDTRVNVSGSGPAWTEDGNAITTTPGAFVGTSDNAPFELRANNSRVMEYTTAGGSVATLGGHPSNTIGGIGATIAGGGTTADPNDAQGGYSVISGGIANTAGDNATVAGGENNTALGNWSTVGGGQDNSTVQEYGVVGGGFSNELINTSTGSSVIAGGTENEIDGNESVISGGWTNVIDGDYSAIPGGLSLTIGNNSFGFNGFANPVNIVASPNTAYFGDVDVWLRSSDNDLGKLPNKLRFYQAPWVSGDWYTSFRAPIGLTANVEYVLPNAQGAANTVLTNNGSGTLAWTAAAGIAWALTGNAGTTAGTNFIGTQDDEPFEIHVYESGVNTHGKRRVMRFEPTAVSPNIIAGHNANFVASTKIGGTIAGGGENSFPNGVMDDYGSIGGGMANVANLGGTVGGGIGNEATGDYSTVGGGRNNIATATNSVIGGGKDNEAKVNGTTVAGGEDNRIDGVATFSTISGGSGNYMTGSNSVIGGGSLHWNRGESSFIGGGVRNQNTVRRR
jgi:hypothetical protein